MLPRAKSASITIISPGEFEGGDLSSTCAETAGPISFQVFLSRGETWSSLHRSNTIRFLPLEKGCTLPSRYLMLLPSKAGVSFSWASAAREQRGRLFNSASNGFILQLWEDQNHLYLMPSTVALLPRLCPSSTPVVPKGAKSALNNAFPHSLDLLSCPMASCSHLSSSTWPSPGLQQHNHLKISPNSSRTLLSFSSHCLLLWDPSFPKPVRCSHLPSH